YNAIRLEPKNAIIHFNFGTFLLKNGYKQAAIEQFQAAIQFDNKLVVAYNMLGTAWLELGERDKARSSFQEALRLYPNYDEAKKNLHRTMSQINYDSSGKENHDQ
ncbi:MAG: tetratricopeptide repeat protein, partial [Desulfobulbaceae bacterium]|nr:tetratricopeptide repeat protein [Desulfobulbaceae bacterium]